MLKYEEEEKRVSDQLSQVVAEAASLHSQREAFATEKRDLERSLRELSRKRTSILRKIKEKEDERQMLETTRDNCIAM